MTRRFLPLLAAVTCLALSACATTHLSARQCTDALRNLDTVEALANVLIQRGVEVDKAVKLANAVVTGRMVLEAACAQVPPAPVQPVG